MKAWFDTMASYLSPYDLNPLNINPLKDLIVRFVDFEAVKKSGMPLFIAATNVHTGRLRVFPARQDRRRRGDGLGGAALRVPRGRDRRRALLGRRLHRQSADLSVLPHHRHRGRAGGADQPGAAGLDAADIAGDRQPHQRDHVQRLADRRISRHRVRAPADRRGRAEARHRAGRIPAHQRAPRRSRLRRQEAHAGRAGSTPTSISSRRCTAPAAAPGRRFLDQHFDDIGVRSTIDLRDEMRAEGGEELPAGVDRLAR